MSVTREITFCFTDIAGSTTMLRTLGEDAYREVLERHRAIIRAAVHSTAGHEAGVEGDGFFLAFDDVQDAVRFAVSAQEALAAESWPADAPVRVRMGLHRGPALQQPDGDFVALAVHRAARVAAAAHGGQVLLTSAVASAALPPEGAVVTSLGHYLLRDFDGSVEVSQLHPAGAEQSFPRIRAARATHGLPLPTTSLVGRIEELDRIRTGVSAGQLVTVTGPGGVGKSRLCLEVAAELVPLYPDGVHVVELSAVEDAELLVAVALAAVDAKTFPGQQPVDGLVHALHGQRLVLLDSCERVLEALAPLVKELLDRCPQLALMATSTEAVRVPGEVLVVLGPLGVPDEQAEDPLSAASANLLLQRVLSGGGHIEPAQDGPGLGAVARRLDGMPLALELAAGRIIELGLPAVLAGLDDRFSLLTNGFRTALPRHRTLEATVAWTVDLLDPVDRELFLRLSCLRGRWTAAALPAALGLPPEASIGLQRLADRSLIRIEGDQRRVRLLDTLRLYGQRFVPADLREEVRASACATLCAILDAPKEIEAQTIRELDLLAPDVRDLLASPPPGQEADLAVAARDLAAWSELRGSWAEARDAFLEIARRCPPGGARAAALVAAASLEVQLGRSASAAELAEQALDQDEIDDRVRAYAYLHVSLTRAELPDGTDPLEAAMSLASEEDQALVLSVRSRLATRMAARGDAAGAAKAFAAMEVDATAAERWPAAVQAAVNLGGSLLQTGAAEEAEACLQRGRSLAQQHGLALLEGAALTNLAILALRRGEPTLALELAEERFSLAQRSGEPLGEATALSIIGTCAQALGRLELARDAAERTLELYERLARVDGVVIALFNLTVMDAGVDLGVAVGHVQRAIAASYGDPGPVCALVAIAAAAGVSCLAGQPEGLRLVGALHALEAGPPAVALPLDPPDRAWLEGAVAQAEAALGAGPAARERASGATLDLDAARALAHLALGQRTSV